MADPTKPVYICAGCHSRVERRPQLLNPGMVLWLCTNVDCESFHQSDGPRPDWVIEGHTACNPDEAFVREVPAIAEPNVDVRIMQEDDGEID